MTKKTIKQALKEPNVVRALNGLISCPVGAWAETRQARARLLDELPSREQRNYTLDNLIDSALVEEGASGRACGRYQWRFENV